MTKDEFANVISYIEAAWRIMETPKKAIYAKHLGDLDYSQIMAAIEALIDTVDYLPSAAAIKSAYNDLTNNEPGVLAITSHVMNCVTSYGRMGAVEALRDIKAKDELAYAIVKLIGFVNLCNAPEDKSRAQFETAYASAYKEYQKSKQLSSFTLKMINDARLKLIDDSVALLGDDYGDM